MSFQDQVASISNSVIITLIGMMTGGVVWLVRRTVTNQKQIEMLVEEFKHRAELRQIDREDISEVKESVNLIKTFIMEQKR